MWKTPWSKNKFWVGKYFPTHLKIKVMILNIFLFVGIIYLVIQCYKDTKEILKDNNETFKDWKKAKGQIKMFVPYFLFSNVKFNVTVLPF